MQEVGRPHWLAIPPPPHVSGAVQLPHSMSASAAVTGGTAFDALLFAAQWLAARGPTVGVVIRNARLDADVRSGIAVRGIERDVHVRVTAARNRRQSGEKNEARRRQKAHEATSASACVSGMVHLVKPNLFEIDGYARSPDRARGSARGSSPATGSSRTCRGRRRRRSSAGACRSRSRAIRRSRR